jgi:hypothetical protein
MSEGYNGNKGKDSSVNLTATVGNLLMDGTDKTTALRVLDTQGPVMEKSYAGEAELKGGINVVYIGTLINTTKSGGIFYNEGKAIIYAQDGEMATRISYGMGSFYPDGKIRNRGSAFFSTNSKGKMAFLDNLVGIWADEIDPISGVAYAKTWELK